MYRQGAEQEVKGIEICLLHGPWSQRRNEIYLKYTLNSIAVLCIHLFHLHLYVCMYVHMYIFI